MYHFQRGIWTNAVALTILVAGLILLSAPKVSAAETTVIQTASGSFDKVTTKLKRQITGHKLVIVKEVPMQKMLAMVGLKTGKIITFEIFHPRYGKWLYKANSAAIKEVPLRIVVREAGSGVTLEYRKPSAVFASYKGLEGLGKELDEVFLDIVTKVVK